MSNSWRDCFIPSISGTLRRPQVALTALAATLSLVLSPARADVLFHETFNAYTSFPSFHPAGDPVNLGIPDIGEGASEFWYGGRFEIPDGGTIDSDLAVQKFGGGGNNTHVGRVADDAGLLFPIPEGYQNLVLSFDWRTFQAESLDRLVVGYFIGDLGFDTGAHRFRDFVNDDFGGNQSLAENWWNSQWVELMRAGARNSFKHESFLLPDNVPLWIAIWLDNGHHDFGKIDNVKVRGTPICNIPEPSSIALLGLGLIGAVIASRRTRRRK